MNRKLAVALILPLMLIPLMSFAYAHWEDKVTKQIKLHAGTVEVEIVQFHVDDCNSYDVNCDGKLWIVGRYPIADAVKEGYELVIEVVYEDDQPIEVLITADPVFPCWRLEFKMLIHNKGRLAVRSLFHHWNWTGPLEDDPCWLWEQPFPNERVIPECIDLYEEELFSHDYATHPDCKGILCLDKTHYTLPESETAYVLKPSQCILLKEKIHFDSQAHPDVQCHWFRLVKEMGFYQEVGEPFESPSGPP